MIQTKTQTQICINKTTGKTFIIVGQQNDTILLAVDGKVKPIKLSTFKRHYKLLNNEMRVDEQLTEQVCNDQQQKYDAMVEKDCRIKERISKKIVAKPWKYYYKPYERNSAPLWDAIIENDNLIVRDADKKTIMIGRMSKTKTCVVIEQQSTGCKRYFNNFKMARSHVLNNQDIRTIQSIGKVFDKWLASAQLKTQIDIN